MVQLGITLFLIWTRRDLNPKYPPCEGGVIAVRPRAQLYEIDKPLYKLLISRNKMPNKMPNNHPWRLGLRIPKSAAKETQTIFDAGKSINELVRTVKEKSGSGLGGDMSIIIELTDTGRTRIGHVPYDHLVQVIDYTVAYKSIVKPSGQSTNPYEPKCHSIKVPRGSQILKSSQPLK